MDQEQDPFPLLTAVPRVRSRFNQICILPCVSGVMYIEQPMYCTYIFLH